MGHVRVAKHRGPRLHVEAGLASGGSVELETGQAHYLRSVLRLGRGAAVTGFNAADGEWLCRIAEVGKNRVRLTVEHQLRVPEPDADLWLLFAPIKRARLDWLVEKATELGASALLPVWTVRTQSERLNLERSVPELHPPEALDRVLAAWPAERPLMVCDESGAGEPISEVARRLAAGPVAVLVGPEGGFDQTELDAWGKLSFVSRIGLGPRVLRAETAALAALAVFQAIAGDWRRTRTR